MGAPADTRPPILIVDDSVEDAEELCQLFEALGARATLALGAVSAVKILRTDRPAIVFIVELRLSGDESHAVLAWLRNHHDDEATRPIYVCVGKEVEQKRRPGPIEFDLYLDRPISSAFADELVHIAQRKHDQQRRAPVASAPSPAGVSATPPAHSAPPLPPSSRKHPR